MAVISEQAVKGIIKKYAEVEGISITDDAVKTMSDMLNRKAKEIAKFAVNNAKTQKREKVMKKDISAYDLKVGFDEP